MKNNLREEIIRNLEIMGINENVISEAINTKPIDKLIDVLVGTNVRNASELVGEVKNGLTREGASQISSTFEKALNYLIKKDVLAPEERVFLSQVFRRFFPEAVERNIESATNFVKNQVGTLWPKLEAKIKDPTVSNEDIFNALSPYLPNLTIEATQIWRDFLINRTKSLEVPSTIPAKIFTAEEQAVIKASRDWEGLQAWDTEALEKLRKRNTKWYNFYLRISDTIMDSMRSRMKIVKETQELIKTYETVPGAKTDTLLNQIGENLLTLSQRNKEDFRLLKNWIAENVPMTSNLYTDHFKKAIQTNNYYKLAESLLTGESKKEWLKLYGDFNTRRLKARSAFLKKVSDIITWVPRQFSQKFKESYPNMVKKYFPNADMKVLKTDLWQGKTLNWSQIDQYRKMFGLPKTLMLLGKEYAMSFIMMKSLIALGQSLYDGIIGANTGISKEAQERYEAISNSDAVMRWAEKNIPEKKFLKPLAEIAGVYANYWLANAKNTGYYLPGIADDVARKGVELYNAATVKSKNQIRDVNQRNQNLGDSLQTARNQLDSVINNQLHPENVNIPGTMNLAKTYVLDPAGRVQMKEPLTFTPNEDGHLAYVVEDSSGFGVRIEMNSDGKSVKTWESITEQ